MSLQVPPPPHEGPSVPWVSAGAAVCSSFGRARGGGQEAAEECPAKGRRPGRPQPGPGWVCPRGQPARGPVQASGPQT